MERQICAICNHPVSFRWTDTHGVGVCGTCGTPYTLYHYDPETKQRLDKLPEIALNEKGITLAARYWAEKQRMVWPAAYDMGILDGQSYSGATHADVRAFEDWYLQQPEAKKREQQAP